MFRSQFFHLKCSFQHCIAGVIISITIPALYDKFEHRVDVCVGMIRRQFSRHYKIVDESLQSRLPRTLIKDKDSWLQLLLHYLVSFFWLHFLHLDEQSSVSGSQGSGSGVYKNNYEKAFIFHFSSRFIRKKIIYVAPALNDTVNRDVIESNQAEYFQIWALIFFKF